MTAPAIDSDIYLMSLALEEAARALPHDDVPIGAIVVIENDIVAQAHNEKELRGDPTAHAELLAVQKAVKSTRSKYLERATLYTTLEPCAMCAGALVLARCARLVIAAQDPKAGAVGSLYNLCCDPRLNFELEVRRDVLAEASSTMLQEFFSMRR